MLLQIVDWPRWFVSLSIYCGLFVGVGGVFFINWVGRVPAPAVRTIAFALTGLLAVPLSSILQLTAANAAIPTTSLSVLALVMGAFSLLFRGPAGKALSALAMVAGAITLAGDRADDIELRWLITPALLIHGVGLMFWVGSFLPLIALLSTRTAAASLALRRFSNTVPFAFLPLVSAGMYLALSQLGSLEALWLTTYGNVLLAKLLVFLVIVLIAAFNRYWLTEGALHSGVEVTKRMRLLIVTEAGLASVVIMTAAVLRQVAP